MCVSVGVSVCMCVPTGEIKAERDFKELTHNCGDWQVQNLQSKPADWRPREELMLQLRSEGSLEEESSLSQSFSLKAFN